MNPTMYPSQPSATPTLTASGMPATHCIVKKYRLNDSHIGLAKRKPCQVQRCTVHSAVVARDAGLVREHNDAHPQVPGQFRIPSDGERSIGVFGLGFDRSSVVHAAQFVSTLSFDVDRFSPDQFLIVPRVMIRESAIHEEIGPRKASDERS